VADDLATGVVDPEGDPVARYLELGLRLGRHVEGFVDAYYGPPALAERVAAEPRRPASALVADAARLVADLDAGVDGAVAGAGSGAGGGGTVGGASALDARRRRWLRAQVVGVHTSARRLAGEPLGYVEEVEGCYGVTPTAVPEDALADAHRRLADVLPGDGPVGERLIAWRESQAVPVARIEPALRSILDDLRERTDRRVGLPEGEHLDLELVTGQPWSGFNYYEGQLRSRVAINTDLPVLSLGLGHLAAHEAYPGHHTEHCRKEVGLVRQRHQLEETIFLVGTPQCLLAEGLADLALEAIVGPASQPWLAGHLHPLGIRYDAEVAAAVAEAGEALAAVRANLALLLHAEGRPVEEVVAYAERWALLPRARAEKAVQFLTDPTWRSYIHCYVDGLRLCRTFVAGDPARFERLVTEQLVPDDLVTPAA
jgi:hypothetical protein